MLSTTARTAYQVLRISSAASQDEINQAYRKLQRENHPDLNPTADISESQAINEAYEQVKNADARATYDATLRNAGVTMPASGSAQAYVPAGDVFEYTDTLSHTARIKLAKKVAKAAKKGK